MPKTERIAALAAVSIALLCAPARAQDQDIIVVGDLERTTSAYVAEIAAPSLREDQLARWDERVCVGTAGVSPQDGQRIVDRISQRAAAVGLRIGEPGCRANIMVIFAPDSDTLARSIVDERRELLGYYTNDAISTGGREALESFANTPRPVRWWHVARNVTADGRALDSANTQASTSGAEAANAAAAMSAGQPPTGLGNFSGAQAVRSTGSRVRRTTRQDLEYVLIIVDARRVAEFPVDAWVDYVAMVSLAQVDADAEPLMAPSILNLFVSPVESTPEGMSDWDVAYLDGLYRASRDAVNARQQQSEIGRTMVSTMAPLRN